MFRERSHANCPHRKALPAVHPPGAGGRLPGRPGGLGLDDALQLAFAAQVRHELGEHAQHVEEALARRRPRRNRRGISSVFKMQDVSRHKSMDVLQAYVRDADLFRDHAGPGLL
jgi:hypothetical protein